MTILCQVEEPIAGTLASAIGGRVVAVTSLSAAGVAVTADPAERVQRAHLVLDLGCDGGSLAAEECPVALGADLEGAAVRAGLGVHVHADSGQQGRKVRGHTAVGGRSAHTELGALAEALPQDIRVDSLLIVVGA